MIPMVLLRVNTDSSFVFVLDEECPVQLTITRNSKQSARTGELFKIQCPVKYCVHRPNVTWCKHNGTICVPLEVSPQLYTSWEENQSVPVFVLHFKPIHLSDNGSYSCSTNFNSQVINSHSVTIHVTGKWSTPDQSIAFYFYHVFLWRRQFRLLGASVRSWNTFVTSTVHHIPPDQNSHKHIK
jgi:hypothetical protein